MPNPSFPALTRLFFIPVLSHSSSFLAVGCYSPPPSPSRHCKDARVYGHTTTAIYKNITPPPNATLSHSPCFPGEQVTVHHRGKPLALDLHCADTLRYPLLSFPRSALPVNANHPYPLRPVTDGDATVVTDSATRPLATREERDHEHTTEELHAGDDMEFRIARERGGEGGHENTVPELKVDSDPKSQGKKKSREGGGEFEGSDGCLNSSRNILASSAHGKSRGSDVAAAAALGASGGTTPRGRSTSKGEPTTTLRHRRQDHQPVSGFQGESNTNHRHPSQHQPMPDESITDHHHPPRNQTSRSFKGESILHHRHPQRDGQLLPVFTGEPPIKHHQQDQSIPATKGESATNHQRHPPHKHQLVPARLVAVLLDGAGKGWMAVKRLWSVREVGVEALAKAGLSFAEVDREQEVSGSFVFSDAALGVCAQQILRFFLRSSNMRS